MTLRDLKKVIEALPEADLDLPVGAWSEYADGFATDLELTKWQSMRIAEPDIDHGHYKIRNGPGFTIE